MSELENQLIPIEGAGGGKGGGSGAKESPNTLRSRASIRVLEVLSQGEIVGLVDGSKGIYFDDTPVQNSDNTYNFDRFQYDERVGLPSQSYMTGFPSVEIPTSLNAQINVGTPIVFTTTDPDTDAVRITIGIPQLSTTSTKNGNTKGNKVEFLVEVKLGAGAYVPALNGSIEGKTMSYYERDFRIERPGTTGNWSVRVTRTTPDLDKANIQNKIVFARATEIQDVKLTYDNVAYVGVSVDAQATGGAIPLRAYRVKGLIVNVPNNYNPTTRAYTGIWNGGFVRAWTDNAVWLLYDLLTNTRYGMGEYITAAEIDKYSFYDCAVYNDALVPDGKGGYEPRFTWNTPIMGSQDALSAIQDVAGSFNAMLVKEGPLFRLIQDRPSSPVAVVTNANVIDGLFNYASTAIDQRVTVANVTFNDKTNRWKTQVETVEGDEISLERYGYVQTDITALGATTEGQAQRAGKWFLESQLVQNETCSFSMSFNGMALRLGDVIRIYDQDYTTINHSGRVTAVSGAGPYTITVDRPITVSANDSTLIYYSGSAATQYEAPFVSGQVTGSATTTVQVTVPGGQTPPAINDVWVVSDAVEPREFKIVGITHSEKNVIAFSCIFHDPNKYNRVELGIDVPAPVYSGVNSNRISPPINLKFTPNNFVVDGAIRRDLTVSWEANSTLANRFTFSYRLDQNTWSNETVYSPGAEIIGIDEGTYEVKVVAHSINGTSSAPLTGTYLSVIENGTGSLLNAPTNLQVKDSAGLTAFETPDLNIEWTNPVTNVGELAVLKDFLVKISTTGGTVLREEYVAPVEPGAKQYFRYSFALNKFDGGPRRSVQVSVFARDTLSKFSAADTETFTNSAPAATSATVAPGVKSLMVDVATNLAEDHAGTIIWASASSGFTPGEGNKIYQGVSNFFILENIDTSRYFKVAHYDTFGTDGLNISAEVFGTPASLAGIKSVTSLPANPAAVDGALAIFYDTADPAQRGIWGWDGSTWKFTRDGANIIANSIAADKLTVSELSAISANMGSITAGNITLDTAGYIRTGGATAFGTGTGIWTGYDSGAYKWRAGTPGAARAEWNGTAFNIYNASNQLTISSGVVDYAYIGNKTGFASISQITGANVSTYIASAAIGNAQIGGDIQSSNWTGQGGTGWLLQRSGTFYGNNIYARGDIQASSVTANSIFTNSINGEAVTATRYVAGDWAVSTPANQTWYEILSFASFPALGSGVLITVDAELAGRTVRIVRDGGTVVGEFAGGTWTWIGVNGAYDQSAPVTGRSIAVFFDQYPGNYPSYSLQGYSPWVWTKKATWSGRRSMVLTTGKR